MHKMSKNDILKAIDASGYLIEQQMAAIFESDMWKVTPNKAFSDQEESTSREVDIYAVKNTGIYDTNLLITYSLVAEIKKRKNPLVFFKKNSSAAPDIHMNALYSSTMERTFYRNEEYAKTKTMLLTPESLHQLNMSSICNQFCEVSNNNAEHANLYQSLFVPLIKGAYHIQQQNEMYTARYHRPDPMFNVNLVIPLLIIDSDLYCYNLESSELEELNYTIYKRDYQSKEINKTFYIDIVRRQYLPEYLKIVSQAFLSLAKKLKENKSEIFGICEHIIDNPR